MKILSHSCLNLVKLFLIIQKNNIIPCFDWWNSVNYKLVRFHYFEVMTYVKISKTDES